MMLSPDDIAAAEAIRFPIKNIGLIAHEVSDLSGVPLDQIMSATREAQVVMARDLVSYIAHRAGYSMETIGRCLGGRDHTTILSAIGREKTRRGE